MNTASSIDRMLNVFNKAALPNIEAFRQHDLIMVSLPKQTRLPLPAGHAPSEYVLFDPSTLQSGVVLCRYSSSDSIDVRSVCHYEHLIPVEDFFSHSIVKAFCIFEPNFKPSKLESLWLD